MRTTGIASLALTGVLALAGCGGGDDGGGEDLTAFCDKAIEVETAGQSLTALQGNDVEAAQAALEEASAKIGEAADVAPAEIKDDVETVAAFIDSITSKVGDAQSPQDLAGLAQQIQKDAADVQRAGTAVGEYVSANCDQSG